MAAKKHPEPSQVKVTRRHLPHYALEGSTYFITFRVKQGRLNEGEVKLVLDGIRKGDGDYYRLLAVVVLPDHVHLIIRPLPGIELPRVMKGMKGSIARSLNQMRGSKGSIWQDESFDRIIRDREELYEKLNYMLNNPVKAGLAGDGYSWPGSYFSSSEE